MHSTRRLFRCVFTKPKHAAFACADPQLETAKSKENQLHTIGKKRYRDRTGSFMSVFGDEYKYFEHILSLVASECMVAMLKNTCRCVNG
jgi:hypothetical protein